ncbi:hypothetical protein [Sediminibacillus albus]|uniref:DUF1795 domain-containing protein n=1 Tax=Sediminibacillus albus TaxID=407036 RepID=A0A1G8X3L6_9BACI|nr:hypothetical protein [Sediminibacillus albus]SDJ85054.1 hypothetical protein SAMN05216243_1134 [Sediminibacillus albus]
MKHGKHLLRLLLIGIVLLLSACGQAESKQQAAGQNDEPEALFKNSEYGILVPDSAGWELEEESMKDNLHTTFKNGDIKAIITSFDTKKTFEQLKTELKASSGKVEIIKDEKDKLSFESSLKSSIRTDIIFKKKADYTYIFTFMTPVSKYELAEQEITQFIDNVKLNKS